MVSAPTSSMPFRRRPVSKRAVALRRTSRTAGLAHGRLRRTPLERRPGLASRRLPSSTVVHVRPPPASPEPPPAHPHPTAPHQVRDPDGEHVHTVLEAGGECDERLSSPGVTRTLHNRYDEPRMSQPSGMPALISRASSMPAGSSPASSVDASRTINVSACSVESGIERANRALAIDRRSHTDLASFANRCPPARLPCSPLTASS